MKEYGQASWCWRDIQTLRPDWSRERCEKFLEKYQDKLIDSMVEDGWHFLHHAMEEERAQHYNG
jgi:hypothetical protein